MLELWPAAMAVLVERFIGYPTGVFRILGHPVQWMGAVIGWLDETFNTAPGEPVAGKLRGGCAVLLLLAFTVLPAWMLSDVLGRMAGGWILDALVATAFIAQKSMRDHVRDVAHALSSSVAEGRNAVARIVGRETRKLDESGVAKAALESLAENTSDGIVAPVFWYAVLGLPGLVAYKAINTADSMIGHKTQKHLHFGYVAAKLDDLINLPASRLTAFLFAAAAAVGDIQAGENALRAVWRDAGKHRSPNAGWPEAAMAGALGLQFGGPRHYEGELVFLPCMGGGREQLSRGDIYAGLKLYDRSLWLMFALLMGLAILI